ncbi:Major facilitator superfamily domain, general substrate transporter [Metarhizium album ARSEF 1941]|uniref:Major facilitator superfamily domain, general substrate transporter n=1 Tax=Metarhizium album (strain ARSEF 1941) TaxID=1081103 RepID=A0A0B2WGR7_METAS|nr:Major facilitator superfamily domain, general substrate transporter [Metarhizium album ARSEF 1941]KHN95196.1 Major facilitator superfamily domain, general substrate transporter [Metarhizium album ARSEF 1941]
MSTTTTSAAELERNPAPPSNVASRPDAAAGAARLPGSEPNPSPSPAAAAAAAAAERWNGSRTNVHRVAACFLSFLVMGANDSAYGPVIPYLEKHYDLTYTVVSLIFLSPFVGYVCSAILNNHLHHRLGQRGVAFICGGCHAAAFTITALHPPYAVLVLAFVLAGFGNGVADAAWNAWIGSLANSSELLGFLHAFYGVGGAASPSIATTLIAKASQPWYSFYYIMIGLAAAEIVVLASAFWSSSGPEYRRIHQVSGSKKSMGLAEALFRMPSARVTWVTAAFLLCYVGVEVALGGWIVVFMLRVRQGEAFSSGMSAVGFWLGITAGRALLGFVTPRVGVKSSTAVSLGAVLPVCT